MERINRPLRGPCEGDRAREEPEKATLGASHLPEPAPAIIPAMEGRAGTVARQGAGPRPQLPR